jgi:hypothetical protein
MKFCPHCGGDLAAFLSASPPPQEKLPGKYDQMKTWRSLIEKANACHGQPPETPALAFDLTKQLQHYWKMLGSEGGLKTIVHLVFDRTIVPSGGALYMAAMSNGISGPKDAAYFEARGYLVEDGRVRVSDDVPIGPAFGALEYWGGAKQHKRWHLSEPIALNPSRNGNPFFMDDNMLAFGATWKDAEKSDEAFISLFEMLCSGVKGDGPIARPIVAEILPIRA